MKVPKVEFYQKLEAAGHVLKRKDGQIDVWALDVDHHNGPRCIKCGIGFCDNCQYEFKPCTGQEK